MHVCVCVCLYEPACQLLLKQEPQKNVCSAAAVLLPLL